MSDPDRLNVWHEHEELADLAARRRQIMRPVWRQD